MPHISQINKDVKPAATSALNSIALGVQVAGRALFTLVVPIVAIPQEYGHYSYLSWFLNLLIAISTLGLPYTAQRFIPSVQTLDAQKRLECFLHKACMWLFLAAVCMAIALHVTGILPEMTEFTLSAILLAAGAGAFTTVHYGILRGQRNFNQIIIGEVVGQSVRLCTLAVAIAVQRHLTGTTIILLEGSYWISQCLYGLSRTPLKIFRGSEINNQAEVLRYISSVAVIALLDAMVLQRLEVAFLTSWSTPSNAGFFNLATQLAVAITILPVAATSGLFSTFVQYHTISADRASKLYSNTARLSWLVMFPLVGSSMLAMPFAIRLIYGMRYAPAAAVLPLILIARGLVIVNTTSSTFLYAIGRQKQILCLSAVTAGSSIVLDVIFIRLWNLTGAAVATLFVQVVVTATIAKMVRASGGVDHGLKKITLIGGLGSLIIGYILILNGQPIVASFAILVLITLSYVADPEVLKAISGAFGQIRGLFSPKYII